MGPRPVQIHLDLAVTELASAVESAIALCAQEEDHQSTPDRWRVMRAPVGT
jgi:hypothetical protein